MKFLVALTLLVLTSPDWAFAEVFNSENLIERNNIFYEKFNDVPISGEVTGLSTGILIEGKRDGIWRWYHTNGQLITKAEFKNGIRNGFFEDYFYNGQMGAQGDYKNGVRHGLWKFYGQDGSLRVSQRYKDGHVLK